MLARSLPSSFVIPLVNPFVRPNSGLPCRRRRLCLRLGVRAHADLLLNPLAVPALAAAAATATAAVALTLFVPRRRADPEAEGGDVAGTWILYTSPTPFNRCVLLRCPSVSFEDGGQLLRRDRHYVNLSRGCIPVTNKEGEEEDGSLSYQRVCVGTADGGVISLDWPHHLDLDKEHGLDTTLLLVPGSTDGSMDRSVKMLVRDALDHGYFPIVMNPRGCAGSPLTTARLFSAGDSDDVSAATQFINRLRPWTTMMSVAWGFGANMLTKYLAEVGEATPLTAAVCINNPFDLDEATRSFPHHIAVDQKLTSGLIDILRANKELFQGKAKGFDVTKALSATSVRDFDGAVSMISNGFATIEDFYTNSSTRQSVSDLKIPVLYIQSDDGTVPLFSIPRSSISENPFTSLLLCSCFPSTTITGVRSAILWCQHLAIEWLSAVELALLKGRHPLLKDVDITVNPSKGLTLVENRAVAKSISSDIEDDHLKLKRSNLANGFLSSRSTNVFIENDAAARSELNRGRQFHWEHREDVEKEQEKSSNLSEQNGTVNDIPAKRDTEIDSEQSQVSQTASAVMNMLDATMPGTLDDEQKKKVLTAVEQGETLMKALQGAVPEDVRGKLTTAVTDILQTQGTKVNLDGVRRIGWIPNVASNLKSKIRKSEDDNAPDKVQSDAGGGKLQDDSALCNPDSNKTQESINSSQLQATKASENIEADSEMGVKQTQPKKFEKASGEAVDSHAELSNANQSELPNANRGHGESVRHSMDDQAVENDTSIRETKKFDSEAEECVPIPSNNEKAFAAGSPNSDHTVEKSENEVLKNDDKISQDAVDQKSRTPSTQLEEPSPLSSKPTSMSVTQALDALTGFDDSTQMAVNSVFGVIENMIDQLEKASNLDKNDEKDEAENQESVSESHDSTINRDKTENIDDRKNELNLGSDVIQSSNKGENNFHVKDAEYHEEVEKRGGSRVLYGLKSSEKTGISPCTENNAAIKDLSERNINKVARLQNFPIGVGINPYWQLPHQTYFRRYFSTPLRGIQPSDSNSTTDLVLDPKEGRWRMLDQAGHTEDIKGENQQSQSTNGEDSNFSLRNSDRNRVIEPSYIILDTEYPEPGYSTDDQDEKICSSEKINSAEIEVISMIKNKILDALKIEVGRRLGLPKLEEIESNLVYELELVADSVSQVIVCDNELNLNSFSGASDSVPMKLHADGGERIIKAIYSAVQESSYLRKVLPIGVIVGSSLASLRKYFQVTAPHADDQINASVSNPESIQEGLNCQEHGNKYKLYVDEKNQHGDSDKLLGGCDEKIQMPDSSSDGIMVGAVTAALGASALLTHHQQKINKSEDIPPDHYNNNAFPHDEKIKNEEAVLEKSQSSLVSSLAEKAMSVAGPVVPTKSDGAVDHERLVALLAELGQKGGMLRLIGKFALLWGGIRGAMSLTDKLISFLHIAERPLLQRLLGFVCMVLLLWSPVVIPLLPTLVQSWTAKISNAFAECSCIIGLYVATTILVILWGKRIRGYDDPLDQYGLHLTLIPAVHHFLKGLLGGVMIILFIHSINALLGYASLSSPSGLPSSTSMVMSLKMYGSLLLLAVRGMVSATGIALVEELLFRSWFLEEVVVDLGYSRAIIVSALAFSLAQRSLHSVPGFLLLSLALFGIKQRARGKLYAPIGIRTGIMTANFVLHNSHLLKYQSSTPFWLTSTHLWHPFDGVVGLSICSVLAVLFFPIRPLQKNKISDSQS